MRSRFLVLSLALSSSVGAQSRSLPEPEIGFRAGWARLSFDDGVGGTSKVSFFTLPGAVFAAPGGVHFTLFLNEKFALEPQLGFIRSSTEGFSSSLVFLALQPQYFLGPDARRASYVFGQLGMLLDSDGGSGASSTETQNVFGGGIGYRKVLRRVIATRYELRMRRLSGEGEKTTEIALLFGFGAVIPRAGSP
jgi:hypothetical protein